MVTTQNQGLPAAIRPALPQSPSPSPTGPQSDLEPEPVPLLPLPPGALRRAALQKQGSSRPSSPTLAGAPSCRRGCLPPCPGTIFSTPARGRAAHRPGLINRDRITRQSPTLQGSTLSAESTPGSNMHWCPPIPELMSQFSFSISIRLLKA